MYRFNKKIKVFCFKCACPNKELNLTALAVLHIAIVLYTLHAYLQNATKSWYTLIHNLMIHCHGAIPTTGTGPSPRTFPRLSRASLILTCSLYNYIQY